MGSSLGSYLGIPVIAAHKHRENSRRTEVSLKNSSSAEPQKNRQQADLLLGLGIDVLIYDHPNHALSP